MYSRGGLLGPQNDARPLRGFRILRVKIQVQTVISRSEMADLANYIE